MNEERDLLIRIESNIELALIRQENEAREHLAKLNCSSCRYAKVCNPKRGVEGFHIEYKSAPFHPSKDDNRWTTVVRFVCAKRKQKKTPIPFEETRIYKMAYKKEEKE